MRSNCYDTNGQELELGQIVELMGQRGKIVFEAGAYGITFDTPIDWTEIEKKYKINACKNDNFVSLWELIWNFESDENQIFDVIITGV